MRFISTALLVLLLFAGCYSPEHISVNDLPSDLPDEIYIYLTDSSLYTLKKDISLDDLLENPEKNYSQIIQSDPERITLSRYKAGMTASQNFGPDTLELKRSGISSVFIDRPGWTNSFYLAAGYGTPSGIRLEGGINFLRSISLGIMFTKNDKWSGHSSDGTFGISARANFRVGSSIFPYLSAGYGGTTASGEPDTYMDFLLGFRFPVTTWLHFRPETAFSFTSKYLVHKSSFWDSRTQTMKYIPEKIDQKMQFAINAALEVNF